MLHKSVRVSFYRAGQLLLTQFVDKSGTERLDSNVQEVRICSLALRLWDIRLYQANMNIRIAGDSESNATCHLQEQGKGLSTSHVLDGYERYCTLPQRRVKSRSCNHFWRGHPRHLKTWHARRRAAKTSNIHVWWISMRGESLGYSLVYNSLQPIAFRSCLQWTTLALQIDKSHPIHKRNDGAKKRRKVIVQATGLIVLTLHGIKSEGDLCAVSNSRLISSACWALNWSRTDPCGSICKQILWEEFLWLVSS